MTRTILGLCLCGAVGCGGSSSMADWDTPSGDATVAVEDTVVADGATEMEPVCVEGAEELCDAVDSDCDGHIDEGCDGVSEAALEIAVAWNGSADLDLEVDGGGEVARVNGRGACDEGGAAIERATIATPAPGDVRISLRHADACGSESPVTASVSVAYNGEPVGIFNREVAAGATVEVASVRLR